MTHFSVIHGLGRCTTCGLVQAVPMPSIAEIRRLYHEDLEHFEPYIAQLSVHRAYFREKVSEIRRRTGRKKSLKLLDIGCAMGVLLEEAKKKSFRVSGIDISADAVSYCRDKKLPVYQGTVASVGAKISQKFDVITACEVIEHERDPLAMMRRIHALLTPDGFAVLTTPNHDSIWRKIMGKWWVGYRHPEHVVFFDPRSLRMLCKRAGFRDIEIRHDTPRPFPLSFALTRLADYVPWLGWLVRPIGKLVGRDRINPINPWDDLIVFVRK
jgi:SAM-dependent methyltransferase